MPRTRLSLWMQGLLLLVLPACIYASDVTLTWNANTESDLAGYKLYQGTVSGQYGAPVTLGKVTTHTLTLPTLTTDQTYFWALSAIDLTGNESGLSNEVSKFVVGVPPPPPALLLTLQGDPTTGPWAVLASVTNAPADPYDVAVYINGVLDHTESYDPRCSAGNLDTQPCLQVLQPAGTYVMDFHVIKDTVIVASQSITVVVLDRIAPAPPSGLTIGTP